MKKKLPVIVFGIVCSLLTTIGCQNTAPAEEIVLPPLFTDHMVLQRNARLTIWGKATPHGQVNVVFKNQKAGVVAQEDSSWRVILAPEPAGGPFELSISGRETITLNDVLIGEVWLASGQSNMAWPVERSNNAETEIERATDGDMRLFTVERTIAGTPQNNIPSEGWVVNSPETIPGFSAVAYFFGRVLRDSLKVPIGLINSSWGGTRVEAWTSGESLVNHPDFTAAVQDLQENAHVFGAGATAEDRLQHTPTVLYNAMIHPLIPFALKGAIWYQGEGNAGRAHQYRSLFPMLIEDWRTAWDAPLSFHFVQLANFMEQQKNPVEKETWPELREAQGMALKLPDTGMAVTIDIGQADDIHPRNKQDVGRRLALSALHMSYGHDTVAAGPLYHSFVVEGQAIRIQFHHAENGLQSVPAGALKGFAIAGADQVFHWADARIDSSEVVVSSNRVAAPVAVRYGWANNPSVNLYNNEGLPASPFRTDDWPGITEGVK